ncbi:MAG: zinc ribbon domain-containing protein [Candidatus Nitrohelix vancouverensis]|uniref:Zinc ribbon domain-containing protein n=1 Tax=Candidatus Nitrohelix vancouverensis TaxID=2705534 RepID=A0A7T0G4C5_9BACT|nr:MAG: zinc ribbon domain-containing protein [Candidatus Nitrohelix vancouverensis]
MPHYDYTCEKCKKDFEVEMKISEVDKKKISCSHCGSAKVSRNVTNASFTSESINRYVWKQD